MQGGCKRTFFPEVRNTKVTLQTFELIKGHYGKEQFITV